ncbi:MAG TPA: N,N-dimethylformamidase beta subunit family domain-containing protein [Candidatus Saccharimonadales bacterium]|nr:N,N-dimethylformamidase beta subunit family domain-containing protein [Candidatus Saccharimonadales bacterium]
MAQLNNSTQFTAPGNSASFNVTVPSVAAGAKLVCVTYGGAIVTASISGNDFTKRTQSLSSLEVVCQDIVAAGGETTVAISLNGAENVSGVIFEFASGSLGAFINGAANSGTLDSQQQGSAGSIVTTGSAVIFSAYAVIDTTTAAARRWWGLEPVGKVVLNAHNNNVGANKFWGQVGVSDVSGAGTYTSVSGRALGSNYQAAAWAYADSSGIPTYANVYPNAIAAENSLPGSVSTSWYGAFANANIAGYTDKISYAPGDTVNFKVNSNNIGFGVEITRVGFYNYVNFGGKRKASVTGTPAVQAAPTIDSYGGTVCAWSTTATWTIPSDATPGVYVANARRTDNSAFVSQMVFLVRSPVPSSKSNKIMLKISDFTWNAYNLWGAFGEAGGIGSYTGRNLYRQAPAGTVASRAFAVSLDRPLTVVDTQSQTAFEDSEISLINFLEGNGYDVAYFSCADIDKDPTIPSKFKIAISSGHDEYWSLNMYNAFANARDAGTHLAFFSSNTALWRVRFDGADTERRKMICYKDSHDTTGYDNTTKYDPVEYTGTWRDSRTTVGGVNNPLRLPESGLQGQWFIANGPQNQTIVVPDTYKDMPIWRNTTVASLGSGASESLYTGSLGYELDYVKRNESTTPKNLVLLNEQDLTLTGQAANDNGDTYTGNGTFTFGMSLYMAPSGALVFCAGTWRWGWGISRFRGANADVNGSVNITMQQATINLFGDMGVPPPALLSTLSNNDATALVDPGAERTPQDYGLSVPMWGQQMF